MALVFGCCFGCDEIVELYLVYLMDDAGEFIYYTTLSLGEGSIHTQCLF